MWYLFQIGIVAATMFWVYSTDSRPQMAAGSLILGVCLAAIVTGITMRLWPGRGATNKVDEVDGGAFRLLRSDRHPRDSAKLVDGSGVSEDSR